MIKDFRYIFKRVIIGILIGLFFLLFKSQVSFADTISNVSARVYFQTQNCLKNDNATFSCTNGSNYRFAYLENTDNSGIANLMPIILNNSENYVYFKNMILSLDFDTPITINTTNNRYITYNFNADNYITPNTSTYGELFFVPNLINTFGIYNDQRDNKLLSYSTYSFKPHYCTYETDTGVTSVCGVIYEHSSGTAPNFTMAFDIPNGTNVINVTLYLGNYDFSSTYNSYTLQSYSPTMYVPENAGFNFYDTNVSGQSNLIYYGRKYNTYRNTSVDQENKGLIFLKQGISYQNPNFNVPVGLNNVTTTSVNLSNNTYKYYFSYSNEYQESLQSIIPNINYELDQEEEEEEDYDENWLNNLWGDYESNYANLFNSLLSSLFSYPISKLEEQKDIDLVRPNVNGTPILNNLICTRNSGQDNIIGGYVPYTIELGFGYSFNLPCPHAEIYNKLKSGNFAFYPNSFKGASIHSGVVFSFSEIWLTIQHGLLVYFLFVHILNLYKYVIDLKKREVEVLEL